MPLAAPVRFGWSWWLVMPAPRPTSGRLRFQSLSPVSKSFSRASKSFAEHPSLLALKAWLGRLKTSGSGEDDAGRTSGLDNLAGRRELAGVLIDAETHNVVALQIGHIERAAGRIEAE